MTADGETKRATPRTMRIAQMTAFRKPIQVTEMAIPSPAPDGAIVRVEASGVCRSDWHFWNQDLGWMGFNLKLPANTGHEVGGVIEEVGRDVLIDVITQLLPWVGYPRTLNALNAVNELAPDNTNRSQT